MSSFFLAKTEPDVYSIDDLERDQVEPWSGVMNPQAINFIKSMKLGDLVLIYHSNGEGAIRGLGKVKKGPYPDPNGTKSWQFDVEFVRKFAVPVTIKEIKKTELFGDFRLVYQSRLSVMPCPDSFIKWLKEEKGYIL